MRRLWVAALAVGLMLSALGVVTAGARSSAADRAARAALPLRVVMYETTSSKPKAGRPGPTTVGHAATTVSSHLAALAWARADAAIVRWNGKGTGSDRAFAEVLAKIVSTHAHVRAAPLIDRAPGNARAQVHALARLRVKSPGYLRIRSRPALFVALVDRSSRSCAQARRWRAAARGLWLAQAAFPGSASCRSAANAWFRDAPAARMARASGSFLIRPGYWTKRARTPKVSRSLAAWQRSIQRMVASRQPLQMIDSLNDWAHGSAIETSPKWASASGFGLYLDALHAAPPAVPPPAQSPPQTTPTAPTAPTVRLAAAGDIACDPAETNFNGGQGTATACREFAVSSAIVAGGYDAVLPLGDTQYNAGSASAFAASYHPSWGRLDSIAHPVVGNHEYGRPAAGPYFQYFGAAAGTAGQGWYSYELGAWHVVALNANCTRIAGGCGVGSPQELWLRADLAAHPTGCTLAYWHQPLFTSGQEPTTAEVAAFWNDLAAAGAEVVLNGHEHMYERFAPQSPAGARDDAHGIREFVVGTGGENHMSFHATPAANSEVRDNTSFGFLELDLSNGAYSWTFRPTAPDSFTDSGTGTCH
jgi:hypothetical protein